MTFHHRYFDDYDADATDIISFCFAILFIYVSSCRLLPLPFVIFAILFPFVA